MKKILCIGLFFLALSGCEQGLTTNDSSGTSGDGQDNKFSFSDMYTKFKGLQEEIDRLKEANAVLTEALGVMEDGQAGAASSLSSRINSLEGTVDSNTASIDDIGSTLQGVSRLTDPNTRQPTIRFSGVNVQIVNGTGQTNDASIDNHCYSIDDGLVHAAVIDINDPCYGKFAKGRGLGNLIVGYNEKRKDLDGNKPKQIRTGAHNIIIGLGHNYSSYGGFVVGERNTISGKSSTVSGGYGNTASGDYSSASGGKNKTVTAEYNTY